MDWTLLVDLEGRPGHHNMGFDQSLLQRAQEGPGFLRLYRWTPACLSFGRNEPAAKRYDLGEISRLGIDTVRRPTGGRAVWHDAELTYAVAAPCATFGTLRETYVAIHRMLVEAIETLGVEATLAPKLDRRPPGLTAGACFASPVGGEVVVRGRKLVGSAQVREGIAFLQHGSILLDSGQDLVSQVTRGPAIKPAATSFQQILGRPADLNGIVAAISETARSSWTGTWRRGEPSTVPTGSFNFEDPEWTWRL